MSNDLKCPNCTTINPATNSVCKQCGINLKSAIETAMVVAQEHFANAIAMLRSADEGKIDDALKLNAASEVALAIKKSSAPFPSAHALLATLWNELGNDDRAELHADIALKENPYEFRAQLIKIDLTLKGVKIINLRPGDFVYFDRENYGKDAVDQVFGKVVGSAFGTVSKSIGTIFAAGSAVASQNKFVNEVEKLISIYKINCAKETDRDEYLMMAETMLGLADMLFKEPSMRSIRNKVWMAVAETVPVKLYQAGNDKEIQNVRRRAEGRLALVAVPK